MNQHSPRYPLEPLERAIRDRGGMTALLEACKLPAQERAYIRDRFKKARLRGSVTMETADMFCVDVLGTLPELVYGEAWWG